MESIDESTGSLLEYLDLTGRNEKKKMSMDVESLNLMYDYCKNRLNSAYELNASIHKQQYDIDLELKKMENISE